MSNNIDILSRPQEKRMLLDLIRNSASSTAKMRGVRLQREAHKQLIKLIQRLFLSGPASSQVVVFSAVEPGSGCTYICTRTAEILANHLEDSVCLVDANFRSPSLHREFEFENAAKPSYDEEWTFTPVRGTSGPADAANLWLLSYRPATVDCPTHASLKRFQTLLSDLRKDFTYVLIDAPPLDGYAEAALFGRMADGLVIVLEANGTRREPARKAKDMLDASGVSVLGTVLNKRTFPIPERLYRRI